MGHRGSEAGVSEAGGALGGQKNPPKKLSEVESHFIRNFVRLFPYFDQASRLKEQILVILVLGS
jgi:hypothetical protein